ncbi:hypothetical protein CEP53_015190, partial [Fusarium sp. AF-6]
MQYVAPLPNLDKLLALHERYLALPGQPGLPGGKMTKEELAQLLKDCLYFDSPSWRLISRR